jgi:hypothetical protein
MPTSVPEETLGQDIDDMGGAVPFPQEPRTGLDGWRERALLAGSDPVKPGAEGGRQATLHLCLQFESKELALHRLAHAGRDVPADEVRPEPFDPCSRDRQARS